MNKVSLVLKTLKEIGLKGEIEIHLNNDDFNTVNNAIKGVKWVKDSDIANDLSDGSCMCIYSNSLKVFFVNSEHIKDE